MPELGPEDAADLARSLRALIDTARRTLPDKRPSPLVDKVCEHLGCELTDVLSVAQRLPIWEHVNVQRGIDAYLAEHSPDAGWFGVAGPIGGHEEFTWMLSMAEQEPHYTLGTAKFGTAPIGPAEHTEVVSLGLVPTVSPGGVPVLIGVQQSDRFGPKMLELDVLSADRAAATAVRDRVLELMRADDVFRGQLLSFAESEHYGNELVDFLPRPKVTADQVVLQAGVLDSIERHVAGISGHAERLRAAGQHLKRGLLLHGPPGTGKTHTVRYLIGHLTGHTVLLLTGPAMRFVDRAAALARRLQPSMVVLEDVDLVAQDRDFSPDGNPLLFSLLDAMDGVGSDADVVFVLTTNRADLLEEALADRPGRVDLAVEIPRPDAAGRARLLRLYAPSLPADAELEPVVAATEGVTASYIKELVRRAVLAGLPDEAPLTVDGLLAAVAEMNDERETLTRSLLGVESADEPDDLDPDDLDEPDVGTVARPYPAPAPRVRPGRLIQMRRGRPYP